VGKNYPVGRVVGLRCIKNFSWRNILKTRGFFMMFRIGPVCWCKFLNDPVAAVSNIWGAHCSNSLKKKSIFSGSVFFAFGTDGAKEKVLLHLSSPFPAWSIVG
jgi:hypothetical protein